MRKPVGWRGICWGDFLAQRRQVKWRFLRARWPIAGTWSARWGFRQVLTTDFPALEIVELREVHEDRQKAETETARLLDRHPDLSGIYNAGGATAGIAAALHARAAGHGMVFVAHEATANNKALLLDGTLDAVIDQNPAAEVAEAIRLLMSAARGGEVDVIAPQMRVIFRENLPGA